MQDSVPPSRTIRVLVDGADWLTEAVRKSLGRQPDMRLVAPSEHTYTLVGSSRSVDVVVTSLSDNTVQQRYRAMFFERSGVPVVAISEDRKRIEVYDRWVMRHVDFPQLAATIREVAHDYDEHALPKQSE
jgi:hypothetical protein